MNLFSQNVNSALPTLEKENAEFTFCENKFILKIAAKYLQFFNKKICKIEHNNPEEEGLLICPPQKQAKATSTTLMTL